MKILQINNYHFIKGGADRVYFNTSKLLTDNKHVVLNFSTLNSSNIESEYSRYFIPLNDKRHLKLSEKIGGVKNYLYNKSAYRNLKLLIKQYRPDIAHLHLYYGGLTSSILRVLKDLHVPVVQTVHDYRLLCPANAFLDNHNNICEKCKNRIYLQCSIKRCLDNNFFYSSILTLEAYSRKIFIDPLDYVDRFIFVSKFSQDKHIEFNHRFSEKSSLLYNFTFSPQSWRIGKKNNYFLFFGRLSKEKGILTLLDAMKRSDFNLKIAGSGPLQEYIEKNRADSKNIEFLGHRNSDELKNLIINASYVIVPSEWYENNPMTVIESFSHGRPVIGSAIGGIPEIINDNGNGYLFQSRNVDDLVRSLNFASSIGENEYATLSQNAKCFAEDNFSAQSHYSNLIRIYSEILNK